MPSHDLFYLNNHIPTLQRKESCCNGFQYTSC